MVEKLISVVIPAFNAEDTIEYCVESIKSPLAEIVVVDDGSKDNTLNICKKLKEKNENIKVLHQENKGQFAARSLGIKNSIGKYIMFLDSDDFYEENTIERMLELIKKYNQPDLIRFRFKKTIDGFCQYQYFEETEKLVENKDFVNQVYPMFLNGFMLNSLCTNCMKREIFDSIYIEDEDIRFGEDLIHSLEIFSNIKNAVFIQDILYNYVFKPTSVTNLKNKSKILNNLKDALKVYPRIYKYLIRWDIYNEKNVETLNNRFKVVTDTLIDSL